MENASKALIIAGGVLIAIFLLTLFTYLFSHMAESTSGIYSMLDQAEISEFNQKFLNYEGRGITAGTTPLTIQDVATLINLAQEAKNDSRFAATVEIRYGNTNLTESQNYITWLEANKTSNTTYNCKQIHVNTTTLLVDYVVIEIHT